jgi:hypothetical protein
VVLISKGGKTAEGKNVDYRFEGNRVEFTLPRMETYLMLAVGYK